MTDDGSALADAAMRTYRDHWGGCVLCQHPDGACDEGARLHLAWMEALLDREP